MLKDVEYNVFLSIKIKKFKHVYFMCGNDFKTKLLYLDIEMEII